MKEPVGKEELSKQLRIVLSPTKGCGLFKNYDELFKSAKELISLGADVNHVFRDGEMMLMDALLKSKNEVTLFLLEQGANPNLKNAEGQTAFFAFCMRQVNKWNLGVMEALIKSGADVNATDKEGFTPLMVVSNREGLGPVELLINSGADLDRENAYGVTALMRATGNGQTLVTKKLIEAGASITPRSNNGLNALELAYRFGHVRCAEIIEEFIVSQEEVASKGRQSALDSAFGMGR